MSDSELSRFDTLMRVERGELRVDDAAAILGLKRRQIYRLLDRLRIPASEIEPLVKQELAQLFEQPLSGLVTVLRRSPISLSHLGFECERADAAQI